MATYLALGVDRLVNRTSQQNVWNVFAEKAEQVFLRQALPILWDYCEINTIGVQGWGKQFSYIKIVLDNLSISNIMSPSIIQSSATSLPYPDNFFDVVVTDPPYYDNVPYSYLSDFFYVWLKRTVGIYTLTSLLLHSLRSPKKSSPTPVSKAALRRVKGF